MALFLENAQLAQLPKQRKQRQTHDCEVISLDALYQLGARPFNLIGAHAAKRAIANSGQMSADELRGEFAKADAGSFNMAPDDFAIANQSNRRVKVVGPAGERQ